MNHVMSAQNWLRCLIFAWLSLIVFSLAAAEDFSAELPRIPPTDPADTLETFTVAPGFRMEQVAAEPLITSPVAIEWDATGRLYVCEMRGYSEDQDQGISRITRLEDINEDGIFDTSSVFVDGLSWPTAIFPFDDGLFVGDAPNLYYFKDTTGDGKADTKTIALTGFGTSNVQGLMNSMRWGLDNRIHIACSSVGGNIRRVDEDEKSAINVRGRDISFDPRSFEFKLTSGAAQHGMCFDDWGRKFVSSNSNHIQQVMYEDRYIARNPLLSPPSSRVSIAADGPQAEVFRTSPVEPWRIVRTRLRVGGKVPGPIEGGGRAAGYFTGATGVTIYRGDAWPSEWKGMAIVGDVGSNLVHRKRLEPDGLKFIARRIDEKSEFITSSDIWFRPAQFANAPDGSLHVIDVCREVIEHPKSLPPDIKRHLDLTAGRDRGRIYRVVPRGFKHRKTPRLADASTAELVKTLAHSNAWHRETAARVLYERQDKTAIAALRKLASQSNSPLGRMHALYAIDGLGGLDQQVIAQRLDDADPQVRRHAVLLAEKLPGSNDLSRELERLAHDESLDVRYQLAFTIGSVDSLNRVPILKELICRNADDVWIQTAVQSSLDDGAGQLFVALLGDASFRSAAAAGFLRKLAAQIGQQNRINDIELALQSLPELPESDAAFALPIVGELLKGRHRSGSVLARLSKSGDLKVVDASAEKMTRASIVTAEDDAADTGERIAAIDALSFGSFDQVEPVLDLLLDNRQPHQVQRAAITTLGKFTSPRVAPPLLRAWPGLSPQLRETASEVLFARPERTIALFDATDAGELSISDIAKTRLLVAAKSKNKTIKTRAADYLNRSGSKVRKDVVDAYADVLELSGNLDRGRTLFQKHCAVCHKVEGFGHEIGPNLATIKTRGAETILVNVLDPNREVNPQYLNYVVLTEDGRAMTGMISAESATSVTLRRAESASDTVLRVDIDQLKSTGLSIMPEGMEETIDKQSMADIITYLLQVH
jgi:putative membrane-bound dehydrogenase-like protein